MKAWSLWFESYQKHMKKMGFKNEFKKLFIFTWECGTETKDIILEDQKGCIRGCEEFEYLGIKIDKEHRQGNNKNRAPTIVGELLSKAIRIKGKNPLAQ